MPGVGILPAVTDEPLVWRGPGSPNGGSGSMEVAVPLQLGESIRPLLNVLMTPGDLFATSRSKTHPFRVVFESLNAACSPLFS